MTVKTVSFKDGNSDLLEYLLALATLKHGGSFTAAVMECIKCHRHISRTRGNWQNVGVTPSWAEEMMVDIKEISERTG